MASITISLDDDEVARLLPLAQQRGETIEQTAHALLRSTLPASEQTELSPDDPDGTQLLLSLLGSIPNWPGVEGPTETTNEEIDRIIAEEAMNPHDDE